MIRMVNCVKLGREAEGLKFPPYPGKLGQKIYENISDEAWKMWMSQQTMLINEYRLSPADPQARKMIEVEMEKFLFGEGSAPPADFVPPQA
ncbi:MAG: oxidative damage protection protein [Gammaproteobacteria bacterium]|nr:MAG: oxidative damage protection protein [Gammaproteobacteria bacterium]RKZ43491.1 MAG: oxidative damage protection protein [Gammaproteobacteria bacterium]RKZ73979.1 MAG: oxidative damage protection protein [Gammaproteobacteria bacterium]